MPEESLDRATRLAAFLREHREHILQAWEKKARQIPSATDVSRAQLRDFIPPLLDGIAGVIDSFGQGQDAVLPRATAERHALDRLEEGFDLAEVVAELTLLRDCILTLWQAQPGAEQGAVQVLDRAVDRAILGSAVRYVEARHRLLRALDRVSTTALAADDLDDLLQRLVVTFREDAPAVDTVVILLRDGGRLFTRASAGLEAEVEHGFSLAIGAGFAGKVAAERRPLELSEADTDPLVKSAAIRATGVKTLYGVPLIDHRDELLGVAHMGSLSAQGFSREDRVLFRSMAARATAAINLHQLRDRAETRARELEASEQRFRATFENAAVGIAHVGLDGRFLRMNAKYCDILGVTHETMPVRFHDVTHPDDLDSNLEDLNRLLSGEVPRYTIEKRYLRPDRTIVWVQLSVSLVCDARGSADYLVAAAQDITPQRRLRDRLSFLSRASRILSSSLDLDQTLEHVANLAVPVVADWCAVSLSDHDDPSDFVTVAHRDPEKVSLVAELRRRYPPLDDRDSVVLRVLSTGEAEIVPEIDDELLRRSARDDEHLALLRRLGLRAFLCLPLSQRGRVLGTLSLAMGESQRSFDDNDLELAQELARIAGTAISNASMHQASENAVQLREQILGVVSHDLRNPIGTIGLASQLLSANQEIGSAARRQVASIKRAVTSATRLIDDLLDVASIQAGQLSLKLATCDASALLEDLAHAHEAAAEARGITLERVLRVDDYRLRCDADRVRQVVANLVGNALKFCNDGDTVTLAAEPRGREVVISVADTGPGIPPDQLEHVFDPYWKGSSGPRGTGLGLAIVQGIVASHGGRASVESEVGRGTTFTFTLPLAEE